MAEGAGRAAGAPPGRGGGASDGAVSLCGRSKRGGRGPVGRTRGAAERLREAAPLSPPRPRPSAPRPRRSDGPSRALPLGAAELGLTSSADRAVPPPPPPLPPPLPRPGK